VLFSGDWERFRSKVIVVEALAPFTQSPAWDAWEPFLAERATVSVGSTASTLLPGDEASDLRRHFETAPASFDAVLFRDAGRALGSDRIPTGPLADLLARAAIMRAPIARPRGPPRPRHRPSCRPHRWQQPATTAEIGAPTKTPLPAPRARQGRSRASTFRPARPVRDLYTRLVDSDVFRTACGRISAGYACD